MKKVFGIIVGSIIGTAVTLVFIATYFVFLVACSHAVEPTEEKVDSTLAKFKADSAVNAELNKQALDTIHPPIDSTK